MSKPHNLPADFLNGIVAVSCDLDGTLVDDLIHRTKHNVALQHCGIKNTTLTLQDFILVAGISDRDTYPYIRAKVTLGGEAHLLPSLDDYIKFADDYIHGHMQTVSLRAGADRLLDVLNMLGLKKGICTNGIEIETLGKLDQVGIRHLFDAITCVDHVKNGKPAPDVYLDNFVKLQAVVGSNILQRTSQMLAFEDTNVGAQAALAAGFKVIFWESEFKKSKLEPHPYLFATDDLDLIIALLQKPRAASAVHAAMPSPSA